MENLIPPYSRRYFFEQQERHLHKFLPGEPFSSKKVVQLTVRRNYHIQLIEDHRYYSVPYQYVGKKVKVLYECSAARNLFKQQLAALAEGYNLQQGENILITGATGCDKSWFACTFLWFLKAPNGVATLFVNAVSHNQKPTFKHQSSS